MDATELSQAARDLADRSGQLPWLRDIREAALRELAGHGLPTTADEDWRYTDLRPLADIIGRSAAEAATPGDDAPVQKPCPGASRSHIVFENGRLRQAPADQALEPGLAVLPLGASPGSRREELGTLITGISARGRLGALTTALLREGVLIEVAQGVHLREPLLIDFVHTPGSVAHMQVFVRLGAGARATIIEQHSGDGPGVAAMGMQISCAAGSGMDYVRIQALGDDAWHLGSQHLALGPDATATLVHLDLGSRLARNDLQIDLDGEGASVDAYGLFFADGNRHLDNHTRIDHRAPHTRSDEVYRGVMDGTGRGVFNGRIVVHAGAARTDAQLRNANLLLSAGAEIDTKPELEIYADDVRCRHGATIGQLDPASVFYLRSRGIPEQEARRLLIASFARQIVRHLPAQELEARVVGMLEARLPGLAQAGVCP